MVDFRQLMADDEPAAPAVDFRALMADEPAPAKPGRVEKFMRGVGGDIFEATKGYGMIPGVATLVGGPAGMIATGGMLGAAGSTLARQKLANDQRPGAERAKDVAANVAGEAVGEVIGPVAGAAFRGVRSVAKPLTSVAKKAGTELAERAASSVTGQSVGKFFERSQQLAKEISETIGDKFAFSPGQGSGAKSLLLKERTLAQNPETMDQMSMAAQKRTANLGRYLDVTIDRIAGGKASLGDETVGRNVAGAIDKHIKSLASQRSAAAGPLFDEAIARSQGARVVGTQNAQGAIKSILDEMKFAPNGETAPLRAALGKLEKMSSGTGRIGIKDVQQLMHYWGGIASGEGTIVDKLGRGQQRRMGTLVMKAIEKDLDATAGGPVNRQAVEALTKARSLWRSHSEAIDNVSTDAVKRILKLGEEEADQIPSKILSSMSPQEIRSTMRILDAASPDVAQQMRARTLMTMSERAGAVANAPFGAELSSGGLSPAKLVSTLRDKKNAEILESMFAGDKETIGKLRNVLEAADRLSAGPGIAGSDTFPKFLMAGLLKLAPASMRNAIEAVVARPQALAHAFADPEGIDAMNKMLTTQMKMSIAGRAAPALAQETLNSGSKLLAIMARGETNDNDQGATP